MSVMKGNIPFRVSASKNFNGLKWECALQKNQQKAKELVKINAPLGIKPSVKAWTFDLVRGGSSLVSPQISICTQRFVSQMSQCSTCLLLHAYLCA